MKSRILSVKEFARRSGVSRRTIHRRIENKKIKTRKYTVVMVGIPESELVSVDKE